jgi:hypothetical protein
MVLEAYHRYARRWLSHKSGKKSATHWIAFMKPNAEITGG